MKRMSEDDWMNITRYGSSMSFAVPAKRMLSEIQIMNPSFDLRVFYADLVAWKTQMSYYDNDMFKPLYDALIQGSTWDIGVFRDNDDNDVLAIESSNISGVEAALTNLGEDYGWGDMSAAEKDGNTITVAWVDPSFLRDRIKAIDIAYNSHPLRLPLYNGVVTSDRQRYKYKMVGGHMKSYVPPPVLLSTDYDPAVMQAIKVVDPTVTLRRIHEVEQERKLRIKHALRSPHASLFNQIGKYIGNIICFRGTSLSIQFLSGTPISVYSLLPRERWDNTRYLGDDAYEMYTTFVTLDRYKYRRMPIIVPAPEGQGYDSIDTSL